MRIGSYVLAEEIGSGAHGIVYKGHHEEHINDPLAVKVIHNTGNLDTLLIEPGLLSQLDHPNIISLNDYFVDSDRLILITEYIDGVDLQSYLNQKGKLQEGEVKIFLAQIADALAYAHVRNIIHRDIKPSNILVSNQQGETRFVLADFGVSRISQGIQTVKRVAGTYHYMAPEQLRGRPCEQSDLWALGVCSYVLLTGNKPFTSNTVDSLSEEILLSSPKLISETDAQISSTFEKIIFSLLERDLANRLDSAADLFRDLNSSQKAEAKLPKKVLEDKSTKKEKLGSNALTWEQKDIEKIRRNFLVSAIFSSPWLILIGPIQIIGLVVFYFGQTRRNRVQTFAGVLILIANWFIPAQLLVPPFLSNLSNLSVPFFLILLFLMAVTLLTATRFYAEAKRLNDNLILHKLLRESSKDRHKIIGTLKKFIDVDWTNINIRQKYIELLLLDKRIEEAIVETQLSLKIDPYNFGLNLLLANGYFDIGLYDDCLRVCNQYLSVTSYSFEFDVLKKRCNNLG